MDNNLKNDNLLILPYLRKSVAEDPTNKEELNTQRKNVEQYINHSLKISEDTILNEITFYEDLNVSGATPFEDRPGFSSLLEKMKKTRENNDTQNIKIILVAYHPDRIARDKNIFQTLTTILSNNAVKLHFVSSGGEIEDNYLFMQSLFADMERRHSIRRVNNYFEINKGNWGDPRVGFGWDFDKEKKVKVPNEKEFPILEEIKDLFENKGELCKDIASKLNSEKKFKRDFIDKNGKVHTNLEWNGTNIKFVCEKNNYVWFKNISENYFLEKEKNMFVIKDLKLFIKENNILNKKDFKDHFIKKFENTDEKINIYNYGCKINEKSFVGIFNFENNNSKLSFETKILERIIFWLNEKDKYYSIPEIHTKLKEAFPENEEIIKDWSSQTIWRRIKKAKEKRKRELF